MGTQNNGLDGAAQSIDLHGLEQKTREHQSLLDSTFAQIKQLTEESKYNIDSMVEAVFGSAVDKNGDTALAAEARGLGELQAQQRRGEFMASLGEDREASARLSNQLASQFQQTTGEAAQLAANISKRKSVGFFDNPLEFIWNQMQLPDEENALHAKVTEANFAKQQIDAINTMETETARTSELMTAKLSLAGQQSKIDALKNAAILQAGQIKAQGIKENVHNLQIMVDADQQTLNNYHQIIGARNQAAQLALSQAANARAQVQFEQWKKEVADTEAGQVQQLEWINTGAKLVGKPELDQRQLLSVIKMSKGQLPQELAVLLERGYSAAATGNTVKWGETPTSAAEVAYVTKTAPPDWLAERFADARKILSAEQMMPGAKPLKGPELDARVNQIVQAQMESKLKNIDSRDTSNPYLIPTTKDVARNPTVASSPLYSKVLAPQSVDTRDVNIIIARGLEAVKAGQINFKELESGLDSYLKAGVAINNESQLFERYSVKPASEYNYTTRVQMNKALLSSAEKAGILSGLGTETIDLLDAGKRREYLVKRYQAGVEATPSAVLFK